MPAKPHQKLKFTVGLSNNIYKILFRFNSETPPQKLSFKSSAVECPRKTEVKYLFNFRKYLLPAIFWANNG